MHNYSTCKITGFDNLVKLFWNLQCALVPGMRKLIIAGKYLRVEVM